MEVAAPGQLNIDECPSYGSRGVDCFEKLEQVGEGTYGRVYMAREKITGEIVALKRIRMEDEKEGFPITAIREIKILNKLHHENVVRLKEVVTSLGPEKDEPGTPGKHSYNEGNKFNGGIYMVFEYLDHDLAGLADRPGVSFSVPQIKCYMIQLLTGLHYCHINQVLHRDIKGSNLLVDNEGNLKLADFGLAKSYLNVPNVNLTNRVITLWYRPPELLLGTTKYGPTIDIWSVGCILAELLHGKAIFPGKDESDQLNKIFELCGAPDEISWPGVSELPWYKNFKPTRPMKRCLREFFGHFDHHALELVDRMLTLDPSQRISAKDALDAEYFWTEPFPCDPKSLPKYESSHEFQTKKRRLQQYEEAVKYQQQQHKEAAKHQKLQHLGLPPIQLPRQTRAAHIRPAPSQIMHGYQPPVPPREPQGHQYVKPPGPSGGPNRYPSARNPSSSRYNHPSQGSRSDHGHGRGPYPPPSWAPPSASVVMPGDGPRGGPYGGRSSDMVGRNRNRQYSWRQQ
ncbi:hypothetical protein SAY86_019825 [Trapa natans]|uniref:Protein kinase domain-containing protein n=1 Tax=Trapa natans TaxID=22666 RepID=A0AAN7R5Y0_TRANT|nr:hypothetical protein SAY86_019825 [Trapa natans]